MPEEQHLWDIGPTEMISFALEIMHGGDFDRRRSSSKRQVWLIFQ